MALPFRKYFRERVTLNIIPHSDRSIYSFSFPRLLLFLLLFIFLIVQITTTVLLLHYTYLFDRESSRSLRFLERVDDLQYENLKLRKSIEFLTHEADRIKDQLEDLQEQDQRIRELISASEEMSSLKIQPFSSVVTDFLSLSLSEMDYGIRSLNPGNTFNEKALFSYQGIGGGKDLLDISSFILLNRVHESFNNLKKTIPQQIEKYEILEEELRYFSALLASRPSIWPLLDNGEGFITSKFGYRFHPISRVRQFHEGIDIGVWYNTPVVATADGVIEFSGWKGGFGRTVVIDHGFGYRTIYAHNSSLLVNNGDRVERGDVVAYSGNSGYSTGPHLHYEVIHEGEPQDPQVFF